MCFLLLVSPRPTTGQGRCFCSVDWHCSPKVAFHSLSTTLRRTTRDCFLYASCINPKRSSHAQKNGGDSNPAFCNLVRQFRESLHAAISCRRSGFLILIGSIALVLSITGTFSKPDAWALTGENLLFLEAWRTIDRAYIDKTFNGQNWFTYRQDALKREPMNNREQTYTAIRKMLASLEDPFTRFLEPEKFKTLQSGTKGMVTGVGLEVGFESNSGSMDLIVIAPVAGGPADRAGILSGDVILAINGIDTRDMSLYDAARGLQGPENSHVELTVRNKMSPTPKTFMLQRQNITLNPVTWHLCEHTVDGIGSVKIGYIRLGTFNQNSAQAVREAISHLKQDGAMAYVLDIRNNSGGLFPAGIAVAKLWLEKGVIVYICDSMGIRDIYEADGNGAILTREPLAVLVNKGTASASEILAGALKDNKRAMILGEQTFGKGKIQSVFELSDGSGMAVTTARYETPMHTDIDKVGIMPDYVLSPGSLPMEVDRICECLIDSTLLCRISSDLLIC